MRYTKKSETISMEKIIEKKIIAPYRKLRNLQLYKEHCFGLCYFISLLVDAGGDITSSKRRGHNGWK